MVEVKKGQLIDVGHARTGTSQRGPWFKLEVKADRGYDRINVWATNFDEANAIRNTAVVAEIESARITAKQYQGKWYTEYNIDAVLKQGQGVAVQQQTDFGIAQDAVNDTDLPFN